VNKATLPRSSNGHNYCWSEQAGTHLHCTLPKGHAGKHWHAYRRVSW
jgi:hypothetical protein